jgi:phenylpropionate dioxygenase-like ring-hydroxylating dioxygenase large terminal subunit
MSVDPDATAASRPQVRRDFVPAADYSAEFHLLEMERVWPKVWQPACRVEELPNVGDYVNYEIADESILVVRSAPDTIRAFYNVCPHRGRRLRDDARGNVKAIFCGYHAWTFDLDGKVTAIPSQDDWKGCPQFSQEDTSLTSVKAECWAGWVWINMDPDCVPLLEYLAPIPERFDPYEWEHCRIRSHQTIIFPVNWKVALEAFVEPYHVIGTHPQLLRWGHGDGPGLAEYYEPGMIHGAHTGGRHYEFDEDAEFKDPREYLRTSVENTYYQLNGLYHEDGLRAARRLKDEVPEGLSLKEVQACFARFRREEMEKSGARYPANLTMDQLKVTEVQIFPNTSVLPSVEGAFWYRARPNGDDPDSSIFEVIVLGRYAPGQEPKFEYEFYEDTQAFKGRNGILEQDFSNMLAVHKGMKSRAFKAARPNPKQEIGVSNIHRVLHQYVYGEDL